MFLVYLRVRKCYASECAWHLHDHVFAYYIVKGSRLCFCVCVIRACERLNARTINEYANRSTFDHLRHLGRGAHGWHTHIVSYSLVWGRLVTYSWCIWVVGGGGSNSSIYYTVGSQRKSRRDVVFVARVAALAALKSWTFTAWLDNIGDWNGQRTPRLLIRKVPPLGPQERERAHISQPCRRAHGDWAHVCRFQGSFAGLQGNVEVFGKGCCLPTCSYMAFSGVPCPAL